MHRKSIKTDAASDAASVLGSYGRALRGGGLLFIFPFFEEKQEEKQECGSRNHCNGNHMGCRGINTRLRPINQGDILIVDVLPELGGGVKGVDSSGISSGGVASQMRTHLTTDIVSWYSLPRDSGTPTSKVRLATALSERRPITMPCSVLGYRAVKPAESEVGCWCCGSPEAGPW